MISICTNTHMPNYSMYGYGYTYPEDIKMLQCVGIMLEFTRFRNAKHKAPFNAFIMSATTPPKRHNPKAWANYAAKLVNYFELSK